MSKVSILALVVCLISAVFFNELSMVSSQAVPTCPVPKEAIALDTVCQTTDTVEPLMWLSAAMIRACSCAEANLQAQTTLPVTSTQLTTSKHNVCNAAFEDALIFGLRFKPAFAAIKRTVTPIAVKHQAADTCSVTIDQAFQALFTEVITEFMAILTPLLDVNNKKKLLFAGSGQQGALLSSIAHLVHCLHSDKILGVNLVIYDDTSIVHAPPTVYPVTTSPTFLGLRVVKCGTRTGQALPILNYPAFTTVGGNSLMIVPRDAAKASNVPYEKSCAYYVSSCTCPTVPTVPTILGLPAGALTWIGIKDLAACAAPAI